VGDGYCAEPQASKAQARAIYGNRNAIHEWPMTAFDPERAFIVRSLDLPSPQKSVL
jgi:hypothetical protein